MKSSKNKQASHPSSSYVLVGVIVVMGIYIYVTKFHKKDEIVPIASKVSQPAIVNAEKEIAITSEVASEKEAEIIKTKTPEAAPPMVDTTLPTVASFLKNPDPMMKKIHQLTTVIVARHEERIIEVLKKDNKLELFNKYLQLKNDRGARFFTQIKIDNSRETNKRLNTEYQGKLSDVFGKETYEHYRSALKQSNMESRGYNIILDF